MKKYGRTDANHTQIVKELRQLGFSVESTASLGRGFPDLAVGKHGKTLLVEVKDPDKPPSARKLTSDEVRFFNTFGGAAIVAMTTEEIVDWFCGK
tara:strand:+ start:2332 stop:2616 length:285 start_codon:yes stop_codon:yes gene_type:complete